MKRIILHYNSIIYALSFSISLLSIITSNFKIERLILLIFCFLFLLPIYLLFIKKDLKKGLSLLAIVSLTQAFSVIIFGVTYKLVIGPDLTLYLINSGDKLVRLSLKIFNLFAYFNYVKDDNTLAIGINFIHFFMFVYFYLEVKKIKNNA